MNWSAGRDKMGQRMSREEAIKRLKEELGIDVENKEKHEALSWARVIPYPGKKQLIIQSWENR